MTINDFSKRLRKMITSEYRVLGLRSVGFATQLILTFLSADMPETVIYHISVVNQICLFGLLSIILYAAYCFRRSRRAFKYRLIMNNVVQKPTMEPYRFPLIIRPRSYRQGGFMGILGKNHKLAMHHQLDEQLHQLKTAVETMQLGVTITDMDGKILYTNPAEASMHGYGIDDLLGQDLGILAPEELRNPMTPEQISRMQRLRESLNIRKDGSTFPVRLMSDVIRDASGHPMAIVTTCEDITERKRMENASKQRTRELALLNRMSDWLQACKTEEETYTVVGRVCRKLFPFDSGCLCIIDHARTDLNVVEFWGNPPHPSLEPAGNDEAVPVDSTTPGALCPYKNVCSENDCLCAPITVSEELLGILSLCFRPDEGESPDDPYHRNFRAKQTVLSRVAEHYALTLINLRLRETLQMECIRDPLTGLYNRRYMEKSLEREARRAKRHNTSIGIIMLDIDHFKQVNDLHGHEAGDMILKELGFFLQRHTRGEDIACRYGGEEFLLILPEAPLDVVIQRAKELHTGVKTLKLLYQGIPLQITISVGVAVMPHHSSNVREVVKVADAALYQAKKSGRNRVC